VVVAPAVTLEAVAEGTNRLTVTIRGTEGLAVQFAPCCRPIPGDPIIAQIKKGQGLVVHTHACPAINPFHFDPEKWVDVQWDAAPGRLFDVNVRLTAANQRGVLARLAAEISEADSNIDHIETEERATSAYTTIVFMIQVRSRMHLAQVFRRLRRIPEVVRLSGSRRGPHETDHCHRRGARRHRPLLQAVRAGDTVYPLRQIPLTGTMQLVEGSTRPSASSTTSRPCAARRAAASTTWCASRSTSRTSRTSRR
jgi:hypothetical protein